MEKQLQLIMHAIFMALTSLTAYGQNVNDQFEIDGITYEITHLIRFYSATNYNPGQVKVVSYNTSSGTEVTIPAKVNDQSIDYNDYWVTEIDDNAFEAKGLTSVDIPDKVTKIGNNAFLNNQLTEVLIPFRVNSIGASAFQGNPLETVIARSHNHPNLGNANAFSDRIQINLLVPAGRFEHYSNNGWDGFKPADPGPDPDPGTFTADGFTYAITAISQPEVEITGYDASSGTEVTIPQTVDHNDIEYKVTAIGYRAFHNKQLTKVTFMNTPSNVTSIGEDAFWQNGLTDIEIPESVTSLGQRAFGTNKDMTGVTLPSGITRIERWTFSQNDLREVTIPVNVKHIDFQAFYDNLNLATVTVRHNPPATTLHATAFNDQGDNRVKFDLVVPFDTIEVYENSAWADYANTITYGIFKQDKITYAIIDDSGEATVIYGSHLNPRILAEVDINGSSIPVTAIADNAFDTRDIQTILIPSTVKSIGARAFYSHHIFRVIVMADEPPELHDDAFLPLRRAFIEVFVPEGKEQAYIAAGWTGFKSVRTPLGKIHNNEGFIWKVTSVRPNEVELVKFVGKRLYDKPYPETLEDLFGTEGHVEIPSEISYHRNKDGNMYTVTSIGDNVFTGDGDSYGAPMNWSPTADPLKSVDIPDTVTQIGDCAFCGNELPSVVIPASVESIGKDAFSDNKLTRVEIPDGVTHIGNSAFAQNRLTRVDISGSVESIGNNAFENNELTRVEIPDGVTHIGDSAFAQNLLTEVDISGSVTSIGEHAFTDNRLTSVTTPANVRTIDGWVYGQNQLTEVTISGNVRTIDLYAFQGNPDLHLVTVEADDPPSLHELAFSNADRGQIDLVVPFGKRQEYLDNGWHGFRSISYGIFTVDNIKYGITTRTEVMVVDHTGTDTAVTIPETADNGQYIYDVTAIGEGAFQNKGLTHVGIPSSVTSIGEGAFSDNQLTAVTIPGGVESIGGRAFHNNPGLGLVEVGANDPPVLNATAFANANRHQIDLVVPTGKRQDYLDNGWNGFKSIKEEIGVSIDAPAETVNLSPFTVTFRFDLDVTGFTVDDIDLGGNATADHFTGSGSIYTVEVTPTSCNGTIAIDVPANAVDMPNSTNLRATATVTVEEDPDYLVAIARDIIVQLDADGHATILPEDVDNGSAYGCGNTPELSLDRDAFTCDDVGTPVTVTLTADHGTESATTTATVTVEEDPNYLVAIAKDITVQLDAGGRATILPEDVDDGSVYGCGNTPELSLDRDAFTCGDVRTPVTVILTANHGTESTTATALVTVEAATGSCGKSSSLVNFNRGFSPNGDGSGDTLVIEGLEKYRNNVLSIYDLSQRLLFSAHYGGPGDGWDGTHEGGTVPVGTYVCVIDYNEPGLGHEAKMIYVNY
ncbi:leucine-rich repeat protein [Flagellimonas sp. HMM57]|uniref:leucine-rich repeat protein n=1 Tax=unclassified Flagellimonas TaxID=2644544 RepID=UPI0013D89F66|nr:MULTISPECIES: leucine-rich repeat protein [unclassified Flagellimonas]UII76445.1 leucine-rich repeat protein [Flagellimonas sp. HMM57]